MNERSFIPKRLTEARIAEGLSMSAVADRCNITPQAISAFESGLRTPSPSTLFQLATNLKVPMHYLTGLRPSDNGALGPTFFRSQWTARTKREHDQRAQNAIWAGEVALWVDRYVKLPQPALPEFDAYNESIDIEAAANSLREAWGLSKGPVPNFIRLLETKGIIVVRQTLNNKKVDAFSRIVLGKPIIFLGQDKSSAVRSRFDAGHELGHLVLHRHMCSDALNQAGVLAKIEMEANAFASAFLLPAEQFSKELYGETLQSFINLKGRWKVSVQAMIIRACSLGLISEEQKVKLMVQISARGMRTREPLDADLIHEEPLLLRKAWELVTGNGVRQCDSICDDLALQAMFVSNVLNIPLEKLQGSSSPDNILMFPLRSQETKSTENDLFPFAG